MDRRCLPRRSNAEKEPFFILDILSLLRTKVILLQCVQGLSIDKFQAAPHYPVPTLLGQVSLSTAAFSHTYHLVPTLVPPLTDVVLHLSHLSIAYSFVMVALETALCHTAFFFPKSFTCKYSL